jgi:hypothetical protein
MRLASDCTADEIIVFYVSVGAVSYFPMFFGVLVGEGGWAASFLIL